MSPPEISHNPSYGSTAQAANSPPGADFEWRQELENALAQYGINQDEVCLVGSFPMFVRGIRECRDLDLVLNADVRARITSDDKTLALSSLVNANARDWARVVSRGRVSLTDDEIIADPHYHFSFEGFKVLRPEVLFAVKLARGRDKDMRDVRLIEEYSLSCQDWDWDLVREHLPAAQPKKEEASPVSPISRVQRIVTLGRRAAANPRAAAKVLRTSVQRAATNTRGNKPLVATPTPHLKSQIIIKMPTAAILGNQQVDGEFSRYDVLLRYLTVQSIVTGSENLKPHYVQMQNERVGRETYESLSDLVASIQERGFLSRYPVPITEEGLILEGAHRLACALYFGVDEMPVTIEPARKRVYYGRNWFAEHGFDHELLATLDRTRDLLFQKHGVWYAVILWPPVKAWFDEITDKIGARFAVRWQQTIDLGNSLPEFARQIYAIDDIERWKVELKLHIMQGYEPVVRVMAVEIPDPAFRPKMRTRAYLSGAGAALKKWVRESYRDKVPGYFYDIVCHTGDNHEHNRKVFEIVESLKREQ